METYSRIVIEDYCRTHKTRKASILKYLLDMSYDPEYGGSDDEAIYLERLIKTEKNSERKGALQDLDDLLFGY